VHEKHLKSQVREYDHLQGKEHARCSFSTNSALPIKSGRATTSDVSALEQKLHESSRIDQDPHGECMS
jgi:hypothetical protein